MNSRVVTAAIAVLVLGGGSVAFVLLRAKSERASAIATVLSEVSAELGAVRDPDSLQLALRKVRKARAEGDDRALQIAEGRVLLALGRTQEAWDRIRPLATAPGADDVALQVGADVLARMHAGSGDMMVGRQALAMADEHARRTGSAESSFLAWQLAHRVGDIPSWVDLTKEVVDRGEAPYAVAARGTVQVLAGLLADRAGLDRESLAAGAGGDAGLLADAMASGATPQLGAPDLDDIATRFPGGVPEVEVVATLRVIDRFGSLTGEDVRGAEAESLLRDALGRTEHLLALYPACVEGRHLAVVALIALWQAFDLSDEETSRLVAHLQWLLRNAPSSHVQRPVWQRLINELQR